jgi:hypothetical protein
MREVAWVIFDEIHYMRDKGNKQYKNQSQCVGLVQSGVHHHFIQHFVMCSQYI